MYPKDVSPAEGKRKPSGRWHGHRLLVAVLLAYSPTHFCSIRGICAQPLHAQGASRVFSRRSHKPLRIKTAVLVLVLVLLRSVLDLLCFERPVCVYFPSDTVGGITQCSRWICNLSFYARQALPYFMIRPMEGDSPAIFSRFDDPDSLSALIPQLEHAIESAMTASTGRPSAAPPSPQGPGKPPTAGAGQRGRGWRQQRVLARLEVVRGVPFYGYHAEEKLFIKVGGSAVC